MSSLYLVCFGWDKQSQVQNIFCYFAYNIEEIDFLGLEVRVILTKDNRIAEREGIGLDIVLENMRRKNGTVIHNSFLESLEEDKMERILRQDVEMDRFNYMIN